VSDIYPNVGKEALKKLLLFPSTYLCECGSRPFCTWKQKIKTDSILL